MIRTVHTIRTIRLSFIALAFTAGLAGCGDSASDPLSGASAPAGERTLVVGSADFPESELLGHIYATVLEDKGYKVQRKFKIGAREVYYGQVESGAVQVFPEYNGALLARVDKAATASTTEEVNAALRQRLPASLEILQPSAAEDKDAVVVTAQTAARHKLGTIEDLRPVAGQMVIGGPPEFKTRQQGLVGLEKVYGLRFKRFTSLDTAGPITVANLRKDDIQVANLFTTDPAVTKNGFVALRDPRNVFGAQNVVPLVYKAKVDDTARGALNAVSAKLTTEGLLRMNAEMADQKADPEDVARKWLESVGIVG